MDTLSEDHFKVICSFLPLSSIFSWCWTSKQCQHVKDFNCLDVKNNTIINNHTEIYKFFCMQKNFTIEDFRLATENNNLDVVILSCSDPKKHHELKEHIQKHIITSHWYTSTAALNNNLEALRYFTRLGCRSNINCMVHAIENKNMHMVNYLAEIVSFDKYMYNFTVRSGDINIIEKILSLEFKETGERSFDEIQYYACFYGKLNVLQWLKSEHKYVKLNIHDAHRCTTSDNPETLEYILSFLDNVNFNNIFNCALYSRSPKILNWLVKKDNFNFQDNLIFKSIQSKYYLNFKITWLLENGYIPNETEKQELIKLGYI
jgi:hypothetical protein